MTSKLTVYFRPEHGRRGDYAYIGNLRPYDVLLLDPDVQHISDAHRASLGSEIVLRNWALDDGRSDHNPDGCYKQLLNDPIDLAERHALAYGNMVEQFEHQARERGLSFPDRSQIAVHLVNEPDTNTHLDAINRYTVHACNLLRRRYSLTAEALNLSTGHPAHMIGEGDDGVPDWSKLAGALEAIIAGNHYAVIHEYYNDLGVRDRSLNPWHVLRHKYGAEKDPTLRAAVRAGLRMKIGEFGLEMLVDRRRADHHGWIGIISADQYISDIDWYLGAVHPNVVSVRVFMTDYADNKWATFDTEPIHTQLARIGQNHRARLPKPETEQTHLNLPTVNNGAAPTPPPPPVPGIIDPLVAETLIRVESGGRAFGPDGRLLIRFEAHIFRRELGNDALFNQHFRYGSPVWTGQFFRRDVNGIWQDIHTGEQVTEWAAFEFAASLNRTAALRSISMGLGQIMGFNHRRVGYATPAAMFDALGNHEHAQVIAFINFFLSDGALAQAVRTRDWKTIARLYNGPGNVERVAPLLENTYKSLGGH